MSMDITNQPLYDHCDACGMALPPNTKWIVAGFNHADNYRQFCNSCRPLSKRQWEKAQELERKKRRE